MAKLKVVLKVPSMIDKKTRQGAITAVVELKGVDSITADIKTQNITVIGDIEDAHAVVNVLKKQFDKVDIISDGR
ncbi:hypothetical protein Leryth_024184 [Lithospermum erythrorhizon]|nr:hypothetical protein Leryth_024184 [Lithospermum erythrorhizon]